MGLGDYGEAATGYREFLDSEGGEKGGGGIGVLELGYALTWKDLSEGYQLANGEQSSNWR